MQEDDRTEFVHPFRERCQNDACTRYQTRWRDAHSLRMFVHSTSGLDLALHDAKEAMATATESSPHFGRLRLPNEERLQVKSPFFAKYPNREFETDSIYSESPLSATLIGVNRSHHFFTLSSRAVL